VENTQEAFHLVGEMRGHSDMITDIIVLPAEGPQQQQRCLSCSVDGELILWDLQRFELLQRLKGHHDVVSCAVYDSASHRIYSASWDK
jgi:WD40 repeat protein